VYGNENFHNPWKGIFLKLGLFIKNAKGKHKMFFILTWLKQKRGLNLTG